MKHSAFTVLFHGYLLLQATRASLTYKSSDRKPLDENIETSKFLEPEVSSVDHNGRLQRRFESAEHKSIGDSLVLLYDNEEEVSGLDFQYAAGSHTLSLGHVVALAGDFYGNWKTFSTGCVEQISDSWTVNPEQSITLFLKIAGWLSSDNGGYLQCILRNMAAQEQNVTDSMEQGKDPAQVYELIAGEYDWNYGKCTLGGYGFIALCNWDHFGIDAVHAYSAGHIAALRKAKAANETGNPSDLKQAYFLEGFALHYLTDLFSTGHLREPRRILHKTWTEDEPDLPDPYPADRCAQRQHDEDCANGLWVRNRRGDAWPAYGDKQLFNGKSAKNRDRAITASQSGVWEIWQTYKDGIIPPVEDFEALKRIPILDDLNQPPNFVPLFDYHADDPASLSFRKELSQRNDTAVTKIPSSMSRDEWRTILSQIDAAPASINMYPFSESFTSAADTVHFRQFSSSQMAINFYGPLEPGPVWNMRGQSVTLIPEFGTTTWSSMTGLGKDSSGARIYSLVGSTSNQESPGPIKATHIGVGISVPEYVIELKWAESFDDNNANWSLVDTIDGTYSRDSQDIAMVKYWRNGPGGANKLELYTIPANLSVAPAPVELDWPVVPINGMFSYRIAVDDPSDMLVTLAYDFTLGQTTWNFTSWSNGYNDISTQSFPIKPSFHPQATLTGILGAGVQNKVVQLYYGDTFPWPKKIGVDVVQPSKDPDGKVSLPGPCFRQSYRISWPARNPSEYLLWFLSDVDGDGYVDIVGYASSQSNTTLNVVVFPGNGDCSFLDPIVSSITIPAQKGTLFTSSFMYPVYARQASYSYSPELKTEAGILSFFDNYGILGARMIAPVSPGSYNYEFKGQTPAVAGQLSPGLGWRPQNLMGSGEPSEAIGFANFP